MHKQFFISGNVPSSKNSKRWTGKTLIWSALATKYVKNTKEQWESMSEEFSSLFNNKTKPVKVYFKFIRDSRRRFDYVNPLQTVLDLMVKYNWIEDDNADIIIPVFIEYEYNKVNPGVIIELWD